MLPIKFDEDLRDIQVCKCERTTDGGPLVYYNVSLQLRLFQQKLWYELISHLKFIY